MPDTTLSKIDGAPASPAMEAALQAASGGNVCHYLILTRPNGCFIGREIESFKDINDLVHRAADCAAQADVGFAIHGAFTIAYRSGKLASIHAITDVAERVKRFRANTENRRAA